MNFFLFLCFKLHLSLNFLFEDEDDGEDGSRFLVDFHKKVYSKVNLVSKINIIVLLICLALSNVQSL